MQLFSIGTVLLNEDGTHKRDSNGNEIDAYSTLDIMSFAREFIIYYHPSNSLSSYCGSSNDYHSQVRGLDLMLKRRGEILKIDTTASIKLTRLIR